MLVIFATALLLKMPKPNLVAAFKLYLSSMGGTPVFHSYVSANRAIVPDRKINDHPRTIMRKQESALKNLKINWRPEPDQISLQFA